jgi:flagellar motor switch protein FliM
MVNDRATPDTTDRRERARPGTGLGAAGLLGQAKLNPFGDLHTVQHLSARLARSLRGVFEPLLRRELRCWAEPLAVQHFSDYRAERGHELTAWLPMPMTSPVGQGLGGQACWSCSTCSSADRVRPRPRCRPSSRPPPRR